MKNLLKRIAYKILLATLDVLVVVFDASLDMIDDVGIHLSECRDTLKHELDQWERSL